MSAAPVFVVSSGRSGSATLQRLLARFPDIAMHHEYAVQIVQPLAVRRRHGLVGEAETRRILGEIYGSALYWAATPLWGDSSNKLASLLPDLIALYPNARFVHLIRDGRKVAGSYLRKLGDECYDDAATAALSAHLADPAGVPAPPPEKRYWWPQPLPGDPAADAFAGFNQFERIAWHWAEGNRFIADALAALPPSRHLMVRLEELAANRTECDRLLGFLGFADPDGAAHGSLAKPHNVNRPEDAPLTLDQRRAFRAIAWDAMERFGYADRPEYVVRY